MISGEEKILLTKNEGKLIQQYTEEDEVELYTDCGDAVEKILKKGELLIIDTDLCIVRRSLRKDPKR